MKNACILAVAKFLLCSAVSALAGFTPEAWNPQGSPRDLIPKTVSNLSARLITITYHQNAWSNFIPELFRSGQNGGQLIGGRAAAASAGEPIFGSIGPFTNQTRVWTNQYLMDITPDRSDPALSADNSTNWWTNVTCYTESIVSAGVTTAVDRCVTTDWRVVSFGVRTNLQLRSPGDYRGWESYLAQVERERATAVHPSEYDPRDDFSGARPTFWRSERDNLVATKTWIRANASKFQDPTFVTNGSYSYQSWIEASEWRFGTKWEFRPEQVWEWTEDWPTYFRTAAATEPPALSDDRLCVLAGLPREEIVLLKTNLQGGVHFLGWQEYVTTGEPSALDEFYSDDADLVLPVTNYARTWFDYTGSRNLAGAFTGLPHTINFSWTFDIDRARAIDWDQRSNDYAACLFFDSEFECWSKRMFDSCGAQSTNAWFWILFEHTNPPPSTFDLDIYRLEPSDWNGSDWTVGAPFHSEHFVHPTTFVFSASCDLTAIAPGTTEGQYSWIGVTQVFALLTTTIRTPEWTEPEYFQQATVGSTSREYRIDKAADIFDECVETTDGNNVDLDQALMYPADDYEPVENIPLEGPAPVSRVWWHRVYSYAEDDSAAGSCERHYGEVEEISGSAQNFYISSLLLLDDLPRDIECVVDLYTQSAPGIAPGLYGDNTAVDEHGRVGWNFDLYHTVPDPDEPGGCSGDIPSLQLTTTEDVTDLYTESTNGIPGLGLSHLVQVTKPAGATNVTYRVVPDPPDLDGVTWTKADYTLARQTCSGNYSGPRTVHEYEVLARWGYEIGYWFAVCRWNFEYK